MQKKHFRILVAAACLCAGLSFSAYGEETISSVPLSFSWDGAPKGGEAVGTLTATTTSQSFIVEGSEYLKDDDTWDYGEWPCAEIELSAAEGFVSPLQTDVPSLCPAAMSSIKAQRLTATEAH